MHYGLFKSLSDGGGAMRWSLADVGERVKRARQEIELLATVVFLLRAEIIA